MTDVPVEGLDGEKVKLAERGAGLEESFQAVKGCSSQCPPLVELPLSQKTNP